MPNPERSVPLEKGKLKKVVSRFVPSSRTREILRHAALANVLVYSGMWAFGEDPKTLLPASGITYTMIVSSALAERRTRQIARSLKNKIVNIRR